MKQAILLASLGSSGLATLFGILGIYAGHVVVGDIDGTIGTVVSAAHYFQLGTVFGLFGIASFFVGLAYPVKTVSTTSSSDNGGTNYTSTTQVING